MSGARWIDWPSEVLAALRRGLVIPAHPLALDASRKFDPRRQTAITRYYLDAGAGGLAVGVHTTQFAIREVGLYRPVLDLAMQSATVWAKKPPVMIAGFAGKTAQAIAEAQTARGLGYHAGLLSLAAMKGASEDDLIAHARAIAAEIPLIGFYLQPAVGGIVLLASFWRRFAEIENVVAIKIAPFNRYRTLDVLRGVVEAGAAERITLYTGNDDHIVLDLLTPFTLTVKGKPSTLRIKGGLLGHWSVWVKRAVELLDRIHAAGDDAAKIKTIATPPSSTSPMISTASSPAATRSCAARACWPASGVSIPRKRSARARWRRSTASARPIPRSTTMISSAPICSAGLPEPECGSVRELCLRIGQRQKRFGEAV
jgi:hypothetical protein